MQHSEQKYLTDEKIRRPPISIVLFLVIIKIKRSIQNDIFTLISSLIQ